MRDTRIKSKLIRGTAQVWNVQPQQQQFAEIIPDPPEGGKTGENDPPEGETPEQKAEREKKEKDAADAEKSKNATAAVKEAEKRAKAAEDALEAEKLKGATEAEKAFAATLKEKVKEAVDAKEVELTDHYATQLEALQAQIIDATIDGVLAGSRIEKKDVTDLLATLDNRKFIGEDGTVKVEVIKKALSSLKVSSDKKPPRTGSVGSSGDRGFGKYASPKK